MPILRQLPYLRHERELLRTLDRPGDALLLLQLYARQLARQDGTVVAHLGQMDSSVTHSDGGPGSRSLPRTQLHMGFRGRGQVERESRSDHGSYMFAVAHEAVEQRQIGVRDL